MSNMDNFEAYHKLAGECVKAKSQLKKTEEKLSEYEKKLKKIADLKKSAESVRRDEVVKTLERYTGKIKDIKVFEEFLKAHKEFISQGTKGVKVEPPASVSAPSPAPVVDKATEHQQLIGRIVEELACKITDIPAWREYLKTYGGYIRKTQKA